MSSDPTPDDDGDDEAFCSRCLAGVDSSEHHEKCVVTGFAVDGESAPTPGDHDELLAEAARYALEWPYHAKAVSLSNRLAAALRTEQRARQAAEAMWDDALKSGRKWQEKADDMQARIDAALAVNEDRKQDKHRRIRDALTESKEPDPKEYGSPFTCAELGHEDCDGSHSDHHAKEASHE